jgi:peptide chain release factor 1
MSEDVWETIKSRSDELTSLLSGSTVDPTKRHEFQKELSQLTTLLEKHQLVSSVQEKINDASKQLEDNSEPEMVELYEQEIVDLKSEQLEVQNELDDMMYPSSPYDKKSVFLEIRSGAGGQEAALFAGDLLTMYTNYSESKGWKASISSISETDLKGIRDVVLNIQGKNVYGHLKFESGVHRVQRVPKTESSGRIHTSTATVAVLPETDDVDLVIDAADLRIDVYRASGAGGQHVNTTDSAVRITHIPTGVVSTCQDERSQHKNKAKALKMLKLRILTAHENKQKTEMSDARKELVGRGMRAEKVRTYNYPQNRVTDHQASLTLKKLDVVMTGQLEEIVDALVEHDRQERRKKPFKLDSPK